MILACIPGLRDDAVLRCGLLAPLLGCRNVFSVALGCLPGKQNQIWPWQITGVSWSCLGRLLESFGLALADYCRRAESFSKGSGSADSSSQARPSWLGHPKSKPDFGRSPDFVEISVQLQWRTAQLTANPRVSPTAGFP